MNQQRRIIVTGTARSGTLYTARLLAKIGLRATHERVYNYAMEFDGSDHLAISEAWKDKDVDVNWMAAPFLKHEPKSTIIWHQVRDPLKIVQCFWSHQMLDDPRAFAMSLPKKVMPECWNKPDDLAKAVYHVWKWTELIERQKGRLASFSYQIEKLTPDCLQWLFKSSGIDDSLLRGESIEMAFAGMPKNTNACQDHKSLEWADIIKCEYGPELRNKARMWGYSC